MIVRTRALSVEEAQTHFRHGVDGRVSTREENRVNALTFLNEMSKPRQNAHSATVQFDPVPASPALRDSLLWREVAPWQIVILPSGRVGRVLALELRGDVVVGSNSEPAADLDVNLAELDGYQQGVSRRHVLLRPTREKLYVIDLGSTNGTSINGLSSPVGEAHSLRDGDLLTLGSLHLQVRVARQPDSLRVAARLTAPVWE
jgi:FHA domain